MRLTARYILLCLLSDDSGVLFLVLFSAPLVLFYFSFRARPASIIIAPPVADL